MKINPFKKVMSYQELQKRDELIKQILTEYSASKPSKNDMMDYESELRKLPLKDLYIVSQGAISVKDKVKFLSKVRRLIKKKAILIHMLHKNGTFVHFIISVYSRTFTYRKNTYILDPKQQMYDFTYKARSYLFIEGKPVPVWLDAKADGFILDSKALKSVIKMEYVELLSRVSKVKDLLKICVVLGAISAVTGCISAFMMLKQSGVIG